VDSPAATVTAIATRLQSEGVDVDRLDGLTADYGTWWFNLRPSNTEPLLRLNVEARNEEECEVRVREIVAMIEGK
jgi:phosphomannomutase